jgi:hypothetical protein
MMDIVKIGSSLLGGYVVFMGLIIILIKAFFPFFAIEELKRREELRTSL